MEQALDALHQSNPDRLSLGLELVSSAGALELRCQCPLPLRSAVEGQLFAAFPECHLQEITKDVLPPGNKLVSAALELAIEPALFPIRRYSQFDDDLNRVSADPLTSLLSALSDSTGQIHSRVIFTLRPARGRVVRRAVRALQRLGHRRFATHPQLGHWYACWALSHRLSHRGIAAIVAAVLTPVRALPHLLVLETSPSRAHEHESHLTAAADKLGRRLFEVRLQIVVAAPRSIDARAKLHEIAGSIAGQFGEPRLASFHRCRTRHGSRPSFRSLLSAEEIATMWHPPTAVVQTPRLSHVDSREFEPPGNLPSLHRQGTLLGESSYRGQRQRFGLHPQDRMRHLAVLGKTGVGKSTLLFNLLTADIRAGSGVCLIDPHGDLAVSVLRGVPPHRANDVILLDASDTSYPVSFNPLANVVHHERPLVAAGVLSAFRKLYSDFFGPRMEHILRNTLLTVLDVPGGSFLTLLRVLSDGKYRSHVLTHVRDPVVRAFWRNEFERLPQKLQIEAVAPIQNKVGQFVSTPILRHILCQSRSSLQLRKALDGQAILLCNLSKGQIGEDASALLGSLLVSSLQVAALSRADLVPEDRLPFHLFIDEFQNFATDAFATILSESRKFGLSLTVANQYTQQVQEQTLHALFGNVGSIIAFQCGAHDAEVLSEQLGDVTPEDLLRLPKYRAYARLLIDGMPSRAFSMRTLPPSSPPTDPLRAERIRRYSRQRYARPLHLVTRDIERSADAVVD